MQGMNRIESCPDATKNKKPVNRPINKHIKFNAFTPGATLIGFLLVFRNIFSMRLFFFIKKITKPAIMITCKYVPSAISAELFNVDCISKKKKTKLRTKKKFDI